MAMKPKLTLKTPSLSLSTPKLAKPKGLSAVSAAKAPKKLPGLKKGGCK